MGHSTRDDLIQITESPWWAFKVQDNSINETQTTSFIMQHDLPHQRTGRLANFIFASRWLQLPLYLGLVLAQCVYVYHFWIELIHLMEAAFGSQTAVQSLVNSIGYKSAVNLDGLNETLIMLVVLGLIDVVMISNLLIMVIVGGYETFVSRMYLEHHPDQPEWLSHVNASVLKVKLSTAIIGISSNEPLGAKLPARKAVVQFVWEIVFDYPAHAVPAKSA